ncbi:K(+)/H(+) antiporter NhaP2 [Streptomyces tendae]
MAIAVTAYAAGALAHGSGFLAVYLASMLLGNAKLPHWPATRGFAEGIGWLAQIGMFVLLGLLVTPHELGDDIVPALVVGLVLTMVARPLSVVLCLVPFRVPWQEQTLLSWAGLRGAVPIILATIPMVQGVDGSERIFNIVFLLVVVYTLVQGPTLPGLARLLRLGDSGAADLGVESAPLERLRGHLLSVTVPAGSRMHGVEVGELRLPAGSAVTLVVPGRQVVRAVAGDDAAPRGRAPRRRHRPGTGRGGAPAARGRPGRQARRLAGRRRRRRRIAGRTLRGCSRSQACPGHRLYHEATPDRTNSA